MKSRLFTALASAVVMVVTGANAFAADHSRMSESAFEAATQAQREARSRAPAQAGTVEAGGGLVSGSGTKATRVSPRNVRAAAARPVPTKPQKSFTRDAEFLRSGTGDGADAGMGEGVYIIQFKEESLAAYKGGVKGLDATSPMGKRGGRSVNKASGRAKLDLKSAASQSYLAYLNQKQSEHIASIAAATGRSDVVYRYLNVLNGVAMRMTPDQAAKVGRMDGVRHIQRDRIDAPTTDSGPVFIGADTAWDGSATGVETLGEGLTIGMLDTGANQAHPSFAAVGGDGFEPVNPLGDGVFLGECLDFAGLCNNKLYGSYAFLEALTGGTDPLTPAGDPTSKDTDGHGSHTASTAAGNFLFDVPIYNFLGSIAEGVEYPRISGVAPHANIIAYKVCAPLCSSADRVAAVNQAITDGVDAINHSIGSAGGSPWNSSIALAFLDAREAGVLVHNSAGNSGPGAGTASASGNAPWVTGVGALSHDREWLDKLLSDMAGGDAPPADVAGKGITGALTAAVVFAGDFPTADDGDENTQNDVQPEQCLEPFPAAHFPADTIVMCDRGAIARVSKGVNVLEGGAAGMILGNVQGGATSVVADAHVLPAIQVDADDGDVLRAWLASGAGHMATINAVEDPVQNAAVGDIMAGFSSRGPYNGFDFLAPSVATPGLTIYAAGADLAFDNAGASVPALFGEIQGTSMASPHAAGASMLMRNLHPDWTGAEILSAFMTTGKTTGVLKEDSATQADPFDYGGGRIQIALAANAGLVLDETGANFRAADPALGGDPSALNVASLVNDQCVQTCSWSRTVRATQDGTWEVSSTGGILEADVAEVTLLAGETATINVTANIAGMASGVWLFDELSLFNDAGVEQFIQAAILPSNGEVPDDIVIAAGRNADSWLVEGLTAIDIAEFTATVAGMNKADQRHLALATDSDNSSPFDDLDDGVFWDFYDIPAGASTFIAETFDSESPDLDLFVGFDFNGNGVPDGDELLCVSATATADEYCQFDLDEGFGALSFFVLVQNWQGTAPGDPTVEDAFTLGVTVVDGAGVQDNMHVVGPVGALPALTPFDIRVVWHEDDMEAGDFFYARVFYAADASGDPLADFGESLVRLNRGADDVLLSASTDAADVGDVVDIALAIQANATPEVRNYLISVPVPDGTSVVPGSISGGGVQFGDMILWDVSQPSLLKTEGVYVISTDDDTRGDFSALCDTGFGGFLDLGPDGLDFGTFGISGDDDAFITLADETYDFYGKAHAGGVVVDINGYITFDPANHSFFAHGPIPDTSLPNGMIATHFIDQIMNDDGVSGFRAASIPGTVGIVQVDGAQDWNDSGGGDDRYKYQTVIYSNQDPDFPEIIMAYGPQDYAGTGDGGFPGVFGIENETGTAGSMFAFDNPGNAIYEGLQVCYDFVGPSANPMIAGFQLEIGAGASGSVVNVHEADVVDSPGSGEATSSADITVGMLNYVFSGFLHPIYEGAEYNRRSFVNTVFGIPVRFRIFDAVTGVLVTDGVHTWQIHDEAGELIAEGEFEFNAWAADWRFRFTTDDVELGFVTITGSLDDGTEHSVSIEFIDGDRFGGAFPSF